MEGYVRVELVLVGMFFPPVGASRVCRAESFLCCLEEGGFWWLGLAFSCSDLYPDSAMCVVCVSCFSNVPRLMPSFSPFITFACQILSVAPSVPFSPSPEYVKGTTTADVAKCRRNGGEKQSKGFPGLLPLQPR